MFGTSIRRQLVLGVATVHLVLMSIFVIDLTVRQENFLIQKAHRDAEFLCSMLVTGSKEYLRTQDLIGLQEVLETFAENNSIQYAMVTAPDGKILSHTDAGRRGLYLQDSVSLHFLRGPLATTEIFVSSRKIEMVAPIMEGAALLGWARISSDLTQNQVHIEYVNRVGILFTLFAIVIGTLFALVLSRIVLRQLRLLMKGVERFGKHQRNEPIPIITDNEIGTVSASFNEAMQELNAQHSRIRKSEEQYRLLAETAKDIIVVYSLKGDITYLNTFGLERVGLTEQNYRGKNLFEFIPPEYHALVMKNVEERKNGFAGTRLIELEIVARTGERIPIEVSTSPIVIEGTIESLLTIARDISQRKQAEESLRRVNRELRAISTCNQTLLRAGDERELLDDICRIVCTEAGYPLSWVGFADAAGAVQPLAVAGAPQRTPDAADIWSAADAEHSPAAIAIRTGKYCCLQNISVDPIAEPWRTAALQYGYRSVIVFPLCDLHGGCFGVFCIFSSETDAFSEHEHRLLEELSGDLAFGITTIRTRSERAKAEERLRISEHQLSEAQRIAHIGSWELDIATNTLVWSDEIYRIFEIDRTQFGASYEAFLDTIHPDDREMVHRAYTTSIQNKMPYDIEHRLLFAGNRIKYVHEQCETFYNDRGTAVRSLGTVQDITEQANAAQQANQLAAIVRSSEDAIIGKNLDGIITSWNTGAQSIYGYSDEEMIGKSITLLIPPGMENDVPFILENISMGGHIDHYETIRRRKDGTNIHVSLTVSPVKNSDGDVVAVSTIARDITRQKQAEERLHVFSSAIEQSIVSIVITNPEGIIEYVNPKFLQMTEFSREEVIGKKPNILKSGHTSAKEYEQLWKTISSGGEWQGEFLNKKKSGKLYWENASISPVKNDEGVITHYLAIKEDITEKKHLKEQFEQVQKIESIGTLASGIAHDFNNVLGIILAYAGFLERSHSDPNKTLESLRSIRTAVERGANLVKQILTFARKSETTISPMDVKELINEIVSMLRETFPKTIDIVSRIDAELPYIHADRTKIHQALMNLCVNARDAMPNGGTLTIHAQSVLKEALSEKVRSAFARNGVAISVTDTGTGMEEGTIQRIFDPFFTTKELGKGTGLGLSVVYGVIEAHKGYIDVASTVGKGTTFTLYLPLANESHPVVKTDDGQQSPLPGGTETILAVEDEEMLIMMVKIILQDAGYTVIEAHNGEEAVSIFRERHQSIDVVLTDMGLPKLSGFDEFIELKNICPEVKTIFASGFFDPEVKSKLSHHGVKAFIQKPYDRRELLRVIRETLDT
jgi:PAS domain S-box-containing protein